ncbi:MAG TPA: aminotransferase class I/II-fold pyridoxal phosphate-dependent enzyme [Bacteroidales bacterium]|jgi:methionine-gamma-lyase|nr:aminotransferase class I/II-fold pyridoxal phosphate-dependent enzyme [Bacteroidales bacterium]HOF45970.1 aminotransferase class I/II-fold pyridoxal phosphate-dependent enzyme [Bacteroidales bacterium]HRR04142.1 aminotransferase class I/II-fold pyridoxal phosphate-dependent enzyme [Bacteroidales bacterium]HRT13210.1 aminotransferase class I/II-fold pyridoxal phosphate-dependent enzyme [Bacteroidales bacterium]HXK73634.1 aminotransferase class I/II-fold pyridoxal phosphate-dependent enzyme [B
MNTLDKGFDTKLIHAGAFEEPYGSATVPIYQTSTFKFKSAQHGADCFSGKSDGYIYTRIGNPTIKALERNIAELEGGFDGIATSSGMGAVSSVYMALLGAGAHIVSADAVYGPARGILETDFSRFNVEATFVNTSRIENIKAAIRPNTKVLYIETPANPTMEMTDIAACAKLAKEHNLILVVDNTFCSPYLQKPLALGADVVLHSVTKFINGHADIVGGVIVTKNEELYKKIRHSMVYLGCNMDPTQAFMVLRGVKTLSIRIERAQENAMKVAEFLSKHPKVAWIKYPGLPSYPQYELAKKQMNGFGSMMSFGLKGGYEAGRKMMDHVHLALLAVSLGGVETLIQHPASMTHAGISKENKLAAGITDDLIRFSVGIEDINDIIEDLKHALEAV